MVTYVMLRGVLINKFINFNFVRVFVNTSMTHSVTIAPRTLLFTTKEDTTTGRASPDVALGSQLVQRGDGGAHPGHGEEGGQVGSEGGHDDHREEPEARHQQP